MRSESISSTPEGRQKLGRLNHYSPTLKHRGSISLANNLDSIEEENSSKDISKQFSKRVALQEISDLVKRSSESANIVTKNNGIGEYFYRVLGEADPGSIQAN